MSDKHSLVVLDRDPDRRELSEMMLDRKVSADVEVNGTDRLDSVDDDCIVVITDVDGVDLGTVCTAVGEENVVVYGERAPQRLHLPDNVSYVRSPEQRQLVQEVEKRL